MDKRPSWSSRFAFVLSAIGSAVGLGNIWRFPYVMGQNGGAVFLVIYLIMVGFICAIPLMAELVIGKISQKNAVGAFEFINPKFKIFGWLCVMASVIIASYYFVVGGWIIFYILKSFSINSISDFSLYFSNFIETSNLSILFTFFFLLICMFFVSRGVNKGIEVANKIMMPLFAVILVVLVIVSVNLPNAYLGIQYMFMPDFSKLNSTTILAALGQSLFTLSVGMGTMLTYGSYLKKEESITKNAYTIIIADTLFALSAGVMIFPAVFSFGMQPNSGAGLVFITLPKIFSQIPFGGFVCLGFFFLLFFAALTSGISIVEVPVSSFIENFKISRKKASLITLLLVGILGIFPALSFGLLDNIQICGKNIFDIFDFTTSNILMPLNSIIVCIMIGWFIKFPKEHIFKHEVIFKILIFMAKYVLPLALSVLVFYLIKG